MNFYEIFKEHCYKARVAETRVLRDLGMAATSIYNWKKGYEPTMDTKQKLANYFGLSVEEMMQGTVPDTKVFRPDPPQEKNNDGILLELMKIYNELSMVERTKLLMYAVELLGGEDA